MSNKSKVKDLIQSTYSQRYAVVIEIEDDKIWGCFRKTKTNAIKAYLNYLKNKNKMVLYTQFPEVIESPVNLNILVEE